MRWSRQVGVTGAEGRRGTSGEGDDSKGGPAGKLRSKATDWTGDLDRGVCGWDSCCGGWDS